MKIEQIKKIMLEYRDFYGGDLLGVSEVEGATTKQELIDIIDRHEAHMESMLSDANSHLNSLRRKTGLHYGA